MIVFIAIELDDALKEKIHKYTEEHVRPFCRRGRWVRGENYHITIKYIGRIGEQELLPVCDVLSSVAGEFKRFYLDTGELGAFGRRDRDNARVLWLGVGGELDKLRQLKYKVEQGTCALGYERDNRFSPHITLARDVVFKRELSSLQGLDREVIPVRGISLMESRLEKGRRVYLPLSVYRF